MKQYCNLELEVIYFETKDVIRTSGTDLEPTAELDPMAKDREFWPGLDEA